MNDSQNCADDVVSDEIQNCINHGSECVCELLKC